MSVWGNREGSEFLRAVLGIAESLQRIAAAFEDVLAALDDVTDHGRVHVDGVVVTKADVA